MIHMDEILRVVPVFPEYWCTGSVSSICGAGGRETEQSALIHDPTSAVAYNTQWSKVLKYRL